MMKKPDKVKIERLMIAKIARNSAEHRPGIERLDKASTTVLLSMGRKPKVHPETSGCSEKR